MSLPSSSSINPFPLPFPFPLSISQDRFLGGSVGPPVAGEALGRFGGSREGACTCLPPSEHCISSTAALCTSLDKTAGLRGTLGGRGFTSFPGLEWEASSDVADEFEVEVVVVVVVVEGVGGGGLDMLKAFERAGRGGKSVGLNTGGNFLGAPFEGRGVSAGGVRVAVLGGEVCVWFCSGGGSGGGLASARRSDLRIQSGSVAVVNGFAGRWGFGA